MYHTRGMIDSMYYKIESNALHSLDICSQSAQNTRCIILILKQYVVHPMYHTRGMIHPMYYEVKSDAFQNNHYTSSKLTLGHDTSSVLNKPVGSIHSMYHDSGSIYSMYDDHIPICDV